FSVPFHQLHEFAAGQRKQIVSKPYNERDGMLNREANGGFQNSAHKNKHGLLFFASQMGVVIIDPSIPDLEFEHSQVIIEDISSAGHSLLEQNDRIKINPDQRSIRISYNCPVFRAPERLRFRYKLEGYDKDWIDADSRREAVYTNLPGGEYQFRVAVYNGEDTDEFPYTSIAMIVTPHFFETVWFPVSIFLIVTFILSGGYRIRLRHLKKRENELEKLVKERTTALRSEKKITEAQAEKLKILDQEKNRFFANISHEFRTPLTLTIGPLTDLIEGKYGVLSAGAKHQVDLSLRNSRRILRLVGQLMDLARLESKKFKLTLQAGNLCSYLKTVAEPFEAAAIQKIIHFDIEVPDEPVFVKFDPGHFDKIVANLLSNAFKFTPVGGTITLQLVKETDVAIIAVHDTGPGIEPEHLPRLFDRFYQVQKSEMQPGSGIGLSLAKELTELHGATIEVKSELHKGCIFSVKIPLIQGEPKKSNSSDYLTTQYIQSQSVYDNSEEIVQNELVDPDENNTILKTILIVDDHAEIRAFIKRHLAEKYNIIEAESGNEAIKAIHMHLPDLIISDVMMPDGDGFSLLKKIRGNPEIDFLPVILLSARAEAEDKLSGLKIGANDYITKPFNIEEVLVRINNLFEQQKRLKHRFNNGTANDTISLNHDPVDTDSSENLFLSKVKHVIQAELADENFTVDVLAAKVNQSRSNLHRRLTKLLNETPSAMIRRMRLELSAQLLAKKAGTVSEIAYSTGFKSVSHFSRVFSEFFGQSPSQYTGSTPVNNKNRIKDNLDGSDL
ncbi:MAG: response regulator, partial [Balneolaceae bacterium]